MDKEQFIAECNRQMANITNPKRQASEGCRKKMKAYKAREIRTILKRKVKEQEARKDAKSKL